LVILLFASPVFAADEEICFTPDTTGQMVVEIEKCRLIQQQVILLRQKNDELERQIVLYKEINSIQEQQIQTLKNATETYQDLLKAQGEAYEKQIKAAKPNMWDEIMKGAAFVGLGLLVGLLL